MDFNVFDFGKTSNLDNNNKKPLQEIQRHFLGKKWHIVTTL